MSSNETLRSKAHVDSNQDPQAGDLDLCVLEAGTIARLVRERFVSPVDVVEAFAPGRA